MYSRHAFGRLDHRCTAPRTRQPSPPWRLSSWRLPAPDSHPTNDRRGRRSPPPHRSFGWSALLCLGGTECDRRRKKATATESWPAENDATQWWSYRHRLPVNKQQISARSERRGRARTVSVSVRPQRQGWQARNRRWLWRSSVSDDRQRNCLQGRRTCRIWRTLFGVIDEV